MTTRTKAAETLLAFLANTDSIPHVCTSQGPGYPIETYATEDLSIAWGEDDPDLGSKEFSVWFVGDEEGHSFSRSEVEEMACNA